MERAQFRSEVRDGYLFIESSGTRQTFMGAVDAIRELVEIIRTSKQKHILADYRHVAYELGNSELYSITRFIENKLPDFREVSMATVIHPSQSESAVFWAEIFKQRGFKIKPFATMEEAAEWIGQEIVKSAEKDSLSE